MALLENNVVVRGMGYQWVSYSLGWDDSEPSPGVYDWGHANNIVNYARNAGINVLIRVSRSPAWARDPACSGNPTCPPRDPQDYGRFMGALAEHVEGLIGPYRVAYEVWNEPNVDNEWGGLCPNPELYAAMVQAAYPRVKAAHPAATVIAGAVTTVGQIRADACFLDDILFLQRMYQAGAGPYFDVLSDHPYGFVNPPEADPLQTQPPLVFRRAERHREVMVQYGDAAKQIWATELGWAIDPPTLGSTCQRPDWYFIFTPQQQADYLVRAHTWARSYWPWMGVMFTFNFDFKDAPWYDECHPFKFWSVKDRPAQAALRAMVQNPPPTYTPVPATPTATATPPDEGPIIRAIRYSATGFGRAGGTLTVEVDASDDDSTPIDTVNSVVEFPDGGTQVRTFTLVAGSTRSGTWRDVLTIPANNGPGNQLYTITPYVVESFPPRRTTTGPPQDIIVTNTRFWDVQSDFWAYEFIEYLANAGVISGYTDNSFRPNNNATRGQFSKMIVLAEGWQIDLTGAPHFTDTPPDHPFYQYVETAFNLGVISGYSDRTFRPYNNITRGQISKIIVLAEGWPIYTPPTPTFIDVPPNHPFYQHVETAARHGIITGYSDRTFRPYNDATRAQLSKMLYLAVTEPEPTPTVTVTPTSTRTSTATRTPALTATPTVTLTPAVPATGTPTPTVAVTFTATLTTTPTIALK